MVNFLAFFLPKNIRNILSVIDVIDAKVIITKCCTAGPIKNVALIFSNIIIIFFKKISRKKKKLKIKDGIER